MLDEDISKKLRQIQAKAIKDSDRSISFSYVLNNTLKKGLKIGTP